MGNINRNGPSPFLAQKRNDGKRGSMDCKDEKATEVKRYKERHGAHVLTQSHCAH